ncbi:MAG: transposase [Magnetococcus sp. DMHC-1]
MEQILHNQKLQKSLSAEALISRIRSAFQDIPDHRADICTISLTDALMSGFAIFGLKFPSLLQYDQKRTDPKTQHNLKALYGIENAPCDTQMRKILDGVNPDELRPAFKNIFSVVQRGKKLEPYVFMDGYYLVSTDGSGYLSSDKIKCSQCCIKKSRDGKETYYHQLLSAVIVHPDKKQVLSFAPEPINKQDGETKNDCERNASKRLLSDIRADHPHLKIINVADSLSANAPYIRYLKSLNMRFIIGVKPGDHKYLFEIVEESVKNGTIEEFEEVDNNGIVRRYRFINNVPLNKENSDVCVNFLEYWEINKGKHLHFSWITDFTLSRDNVFMIMKGGRARWKIENETFNTLKNQGYHLEHNYGHGEKNLTTIFLLLMMLSFLVDQVQEIGCSMFQQAKQKEKSKKSLWESIRALFRCFYVASWYDLFASLTYNQFGGKLVPICP